MLRRPPREAKALVKQSAEHHTQPSFASALAGWPNRVLENTHGSCKPRPLQKSLGCVSGAPAGRFRVGFSSDSSCKDDNAAATAGRFRTGACAAGMGAGGINTDEQVGTDGVANFPGRCRTPGACAAAMRTPAYVVASLSESVAAPDSCVTCS